MAKNEASVFFIFISKTIHPKLNGFCNFKWFCVFFVTRTHKHDFWGTLKRFYHQISPRTERLSIDSEFNQMYVYIKKAICAGGPYVWRGWGGGGACNFATLKAQKATTTTATKINKKEESLYVTRIRLRDTFNVTFASCCWSG